MMRWLFTFSCVAKVRCKTEPGLAVPAGSNTTTLAVWLAVSSFHVSEESCQVRLLGGDDRHRSLHRVICGSLETTVIMTPAPYSGRFRPAVHSQELDPVFSCFIFYIQLILGDVGPQTSLYCRAFQKCDLQTLKVNYFRLNISGKINISTDI